MLGEDHHRVHPAAALDKLPPPVADDADIFAFPFDRAVGHSSISLSGNFVGVCVRSWENARPAPAPISSTAATIPSPGRPAFTWVEQRRHRLAPGLGRGHRGDRLVADDLGAMLGHRQIDEDAGAADRPPLAAGLEQHDRAPPHPPGLGRAGRQQQPQRHPFEDEQHRQEFEQRKAEQQRQQLAHGSARRPSPSAGSTNARSCCGQAAKKASTRNNTSTA